MHIYDVNYKDIMIWVRITVSLIIILFIYFRLMSLIWVTNLINVCLGIILVFISSIYISIINTAIYIIIIILHIILLYLSYLTY